MFSLGHQASKYRANLSGGGTTKMMGIFHILPRFVICEVTLSLQRGAELGLKTCLPNTGKKRNEIRTLRLLDSGAQGNVFLFQDLI